jgi:transposase
MKRRQRRNYTPEFRREAACLILDQGYTYRQACESLDLTSTALRNWVNQLQEERNGSTPKSAAMTPEQQKIQELEAKVNRLEREKSILKKATALLMSDEFNRTP